MKVRLPCYFALSCYYPLSNFLRLFAAQLLISWGAAGEETGYGEQRVAISPRNNSNRPKLTDYMDTSVQMRQERFPVVLSSNCYLPVAVPLITHVSCSGAVSDGPAPAPSPPSAR